MLENDPASLAPSRWAILSCRAKVETSLAIPVSKNQRFLDRARNDKKAPADMTPHGLAASPRQAYSWSWRDERHRVPQFWDMTAAHVPPVNPAPDPDLQLNRPDVPGRSSNVTNFPARLSLVLRSMRDAQSSFPRRPDWSRA